MSIASQFCRKPSGTCPFEDECEGRECRHATQFPARESESVLEEAHRLIYGERQDEYGPGHEEMDQVAQVWSVIIGTPVTAYQAALCLSGLKLVRARNGYKRDNLVDGAGYLGLAQRVVDRR